MKTHWKYVAGLILTALAALGMGLAAAPYLVREGPRLAGRLDVVAFRPLIAGGCETEESRVAAVTDHLTQTRLARLWEPLRAAPAWAGNQGPCRVSGARWRLKNLIVNAGETELRDCFNGNAGTACTDSVDGWNFHGIGTGATAAAETDTGCQTELTTQYSPDNTRATGSQTPNRATVYRTVGTNTVDAAVGAT